jgi:hypothetical protein
MKIKTIEMFRRNHDYVGLSYWEANEMFNRNHDYVGLSYWEAEKILDRESMFMCHDALKRFFPSMNRRKRVTMNVYTHAVKASQKFHIRRPYRIMGYIKGIDGIGDMFQSMRLIIDEILDQCNKEEMTVWVTVE